MPANASCLVHNQKEFLVLKNIVVARKMAFQFKNLQPLTVSSFMGADCTNTAQRRRCWLYCNIFTVLWCKVFQKLNWHFFPPELTGADLSAASPTEAKFRAELKKLHQQYPDHILLFTWLFTHYLFTWPVIENCNLKGTIFPISGGERKLNSKRGSRTILRGSLACNLPLSTLLNTTCKDPCEFLTWSEVG